MNVSKYVMRDGGLDMEQIDDGDSILVRLRNGDEFRIAEERGRLEIMATGTMGHELDVRPHVANAISVGVVPCGRKVRKR